MRDDARIILLLVALAMTRFHPTRLALAFLVWPLLGGGTLAGCVDARTPLQQPTTLKLYPHAMDRLARLMRAAYTDSQPAAIEQSILCEEHRVEMALGTRDFDIRLAWMHDSLDKEFSSAELRQMEDRLAGSYFDVGPSERCAALLSEAQREVPLPGRKFRTMMEDPIPPLPAPAATHVAP